MMSDLSRLTGEILELLKAGELEKALQLSGEARRRARADTLSARQLAVHEVTLGIVEVRRMREHILRQADTQPEAQRAYAREQLEKICRELYDPQIASLQTRKRAYSRPGNSAT